MRPNDTPLATCNDVTLSAEDYLQSLHLQRRLTPTLVDALTEKLILAEAEKLGVVASDEELQRAADDFRQRSGLQSAAATEAWLRRERWSLADLEQAVERKLVIAKFTDHVTKEKIEEYFTDHRTAFDRLQLRVIVVGREDLAQELVLQIQEEGEDFAALAQEHSMDPSRASGGRLNPIERGRLPTSIADAIKDARDGKLVGPVTTPQGFHIVLVESVSAAELNDTTAKQIRDLLFQEWLRQFMADKEVALPALESREPIS